MSPTAATMIEHVYVAAITRKTIDVGENSLAQGNAHIQKRFKPCYSNETLHVFCSTDNLDTVRDFFEHTCAVLPLDYILVQTDRDHFRYSSPAVGRCFDGSLRFAGPRESGGLGDLADESKYTQVR